MTRISRIGFVLLAGLWSGVFAQEEGGEPQPTTSSQSASCLEASPVFSAEPQSKPESIVPLQNPEVKETEQSFSGGPPPRPEMIILTSCRPEAEDGIGLFFRADYLILQALESNLVYARDEFKAGVQETLGCFVGSFDWKSGFRLDLGYNAGYDSWDSQWIWTWFFDEGTNSAVAKPGTVLVNTTQIVSNLPSSDCGSAESVLKLHMNILDWELGREFCVSRHLSLRPFGSLRTSWLRQQWDTKYGPTGGLSFLEFDAKFKQKFWGIGPRLGLDGEWRLGKGFSAYTNGAGSLLYGFFFNSANHFQIQGNGAIMPFGVFNRWFRNEQPIFELQMGLRWSRSCFDEKSRFTIQGGWEHMIFLDFNHMFYTWSPIPEIWAHLLDMGGNLSIQGWSISTRVDF